MQVGEGSITGLCWIVSRHHKHSFSFITACSWDLTLENRETICVVNQLKATFEAEENLRINEIYVKTQQKVSLIFIFEGKYISTGFGQGRNGHNMRLLCEQPILKISELLLEIGSMATVPCKIILRKSLQFLFSLSQLKTKLLLQLFRK